MENLQMNYFNAKKDFEFWKVEKKEKNVFFCYDNVREKYIVVVFWSKDFIQRFYPYIEILKH